MTLKKKFRPENPDGFEPLFTNVIKTATVGSWKIYISDLPNPKSGLFIPKKLMPLSVDRHRLRRRGSELLANYCDSHSILLRLMKKTDPEVQLNDVKIKLQELVTELSNTTSPSI